MEKKSDTEQRERDRGNRERVEKKLKIWSGKSKTEAFNSWRVDVHVPLRRTSFKAS